MKIPRPLNFKHKKEDSLAILPWQKPVAQNLEFSQLKPLNEEITLNKVRSRKTLFDSNFESLLQHDHKSALQNLNCKVETYGE